MNLSRIALLPLLLATASCGCPPAAEPPRAKGLMELYNTGVAAMQEEKWEEAAVVWKDSITRFEDAAGEFGPAFGLLHYHLGLCQYRLEEYADAASSFKICYQKFPNAKGAENKNLYHHHSLNYWAKCEQARGNHDNAIELYKQFVEESPREEREAARAAIRHAEAARG